ncbi:TRAP transporter small permease subunit [Roseibium aggregatum]|uniref:TRAP transporter small permease protein n=1 Tax=Roseibium aggregatum TaxID=187304 RepID=A0A926S4K4_9HYPH|nr:TRAP transporter small permease subunit [Roseibium aggregatum]MBD1545185.1 TRAP transporter small permease subunit [Roseibium aggregatum]
MTSTDGIAADGTRGTTDGRAVAIMVRIFGWATLFCLTAFLFNDFLVYWLGWPGTATFNAGAVDVRSWLQAGLYAAVLPAAAWHVLRHRERPLRDESQRVDRINGFLIRAAFWAVLLIGLVDISLAFLRGEDLIDGLAGKTLAFELFRSEIRGAYVHMPLIALGIVIASLTRTIGVTWLALLIVVAELLIVMFRFMFSYEQLYMTDLVRFWYAALFLLGCAYTLRQDGHVRVDVFYAGFSRRTKGLVNAFGTLLLGMPFCWLILIVGTSGKTGVINSALLTYEIEGLGDGLYILYLMTVFMGLFAITMLIAFVSFLFDGTADYLGEAGGSDPAADTDSHPAGRDA